MADEAEKMAGVEASIADALQPSAPNFGKRPRVYPVVEQETKADPNEPVRTLTQFLTDIDERVVVLGRATVEQERNLAEILQAIHERLARIENTIGVR